MKFIVLLFNLLIFIKINKIYMFLFLKKRFYMFFVKNKLTFVAFFERKILA